MDPIMIITKVEVPMQVSVAAFIAAADAELVDRKGAGPGSLTEDGLRYRVASGRKVREVARPLWDWAHQTIPALVQQHTGVAWRMSDVEDAVINVNVLRGRGEKYELHLDPNPLTVVLYLTDHADGGEFIYYDASPFSSARHVVKPARGRVVIMEGCKIPHAVLPMKDGSARVSVPMELYRADAANDLNYSHADAGLYGGAGNGR